MPPLPGTPMNSRLPRLLLLTLLTACFASLPGTARAQLQGTTLCVFPQISCPDSTPPSIVIFTDGVSSPNVDSVPPNTKLGISIGICSNVLFATQNPWSAVYDGQTITSSFVMQNPPGSVNFQCSGHWVYGVDSIVIGPGSHLLTVTATTLNHVSNQRNAGWYQPRWGVTVQAANPTVNVPINTNGATTFTLTNVGGTAATYSIHATCSGAAIVSSPPCTVSPTSIGPLNSGAQAPVSVSYTTTGTSLALGAVGVQVTQLPDSASATGTTTVHTVSLQTPPINAQDARRRDRCFRAYVARNAEYECGDLRYSYALPTIHRVGKSITPRLVYSSQSAHSHPLIGADVVVPAHGDSVTIQVQAHLYLDGNDAVDMCNAVWPGSGFPFGQTRRIVCRFDGLNYWGVHTWELQVRATIGPPNQIQPTGINVQIADLSGVITVENGYPGPFGAGWYFEGVETFAVGSDTSAGTWTGGDGSMVRYFPKSKVSNNTVWYPSNADHADSITLNSNGTYTHWEEHGMQAQIYSFGIQKAVIDPLGYSTNFTYNGPHANISEIQLPQMTGTGATPITITYAAPVDSANGVLATNGDPTINMPMGVGGTTGAYHVHLVNQQLAWISSPDGDTVKFGVTNGVMTSVTDKNGNVTTFTYDSAYKLTSSTINMGSQPAIVRQFRAAESVGLGLSTGNPISDSTYIPPDSATTVLKGPRTDVSQVTTIWLDALGQATGVSDALGQITAIGRTDARWPGLPTRIVYPNGQTMTAVYDGHGNLQSATDANPYGTGDATTTYKYDPKWDLVTSTLSPMGAATSMAYDQTDANRLWQQPGSDTTDHSHRTIFAYDQTSKLITLIYPPTMPAQQIVYDSLGNVSKTVSGLGHKTWFNNDALGRDTLTAMQLDSLGQNWLTTRYWFDALGRDTLTKTYGPSLTGKTTILKNFSTAPETLTVQTFYNRESVVDSVRRSMSPDSNTIGVATTGYRYDPAYRETQEIDPLGVADVYQYDPAGNRTLWTTRRGLLVSSTYDALNRLHTRTTPEVLYNQLTASGWAGYGWVYPFAPYANSAGGYTIPTDVATFTYDAVGHIASAVNGDAQVRRTYYLDGSVATDTLAIRTYVGNNFTTHVYGLAYTYDLDGRRATLARPTNLTSPPPSETTSYTYDPLTGKLATITDFHRRAFAYTYDVVGRPATLTYPGQIVESWIYDGDGRLMTRLEKSALGGAAGYTDSLVHLDTYVYDWRDKPISVATLMDTTYFLYTALGNLYESYNKTDTLQASDIEIGKPDALGNHALRNYTSTRISAQAADNYSYQYQAKSGRLMAGTGTAAGLSYQELAWYDADGNRGQYVTGNTLSGGFNDEVVSYYAADNRLRALDHRRCNGIVPGNGCPVANGGQLRGTFEEYRYDALGRRVLVRSNRDPLCTQTQCPCTGTGCTSEIKAVIWDGNQDLFELRADGTGTNGPTDAGMDAYDAQPTGANTQFFGRAGYTIGATLDVPLAVERPTGASRQYFIPHANWHGLFDQGTDSAGTFINCSPPACIDWPAIPNALDYSLLARQEANLDGWSGDLVNQSRDISGQMYMRNRYYDPTTGRFTQEDPAGLGGGLNTYGFAAGDPVNYSDPFGLQCERNGGGGDDNKCTAVEQAGAAYQSFKNKVITAVGDFGNAAWSTLAKVGKELAIQLGLAAVTDGAGPLVEDGALLARSLASEELLGQAEAGIGTVIAGNGSSTALRDAGRLASEYGGNAADYAKVVTNTRTAGGITQQIHYYRDVVRGVTVEPKTVISP